MIEPGLRDWILQRTAITAQLSGGGAKPVYIDDADQDAQEYILIESDGIEADDMLDEFDVDDLLDETVAVTVKCETAGKAKSIASSLLSAGIAGLSGQLTDRHIEGCWFSGMEADYEAPDDGSAKGRHLQTITLQIHHRKQ